MDDIVKAFARDWIEPSSYTSSYRSLCKKCGGITDRGEMCIPCLKSLLAKTLALSTLGTEDQELVEEVRGLLRDKNVLDEIKKHK